MQNSKFQVGDLVVRASGGDWFGMSEGDTAVVRAIKPTPNNWHQLRLHGYGGLYSDFRFKLARDHSPDDSQLAETDK